MSTLNLHLVVSPSKVAECARALRDRLSPTDWATMAALSAEVVSLHETLASGQTTLVVPVATERAREALAALAKR